MASSRAQRSGDWLSTLNDNRISSALSPSKWNILCFGNQAERPASFVRYRKGLSPLQTTPRYPELVSLPHRWPLPPLYRTHVCMEAFYVLLRQVHATIRRVYSKSPKSTYPPIHRRFIGSYLEPNRTPKTPTLLDQLLLKAGLRRKRRKGCWDGSPRLDHLGSVIDTNAQVFGITDKRVQKIQAMARKLLHQARQNRTLVETFLSRHFLGVAISCSLAMPLARFYTRPLHDTLRRTAKWGVKLNYAAIGDLVHWKNLVKSPSTHPLHHKTATMAIHSDSSTSTEMGAAFWGTTSEWGNQGSGKRKGYGIHTYGRSPSPF